MSLFDDFSEQITGVEAISAAVIAEVCRQRGDLWAEALRANFSELLLDIERRCYETYQREEERVGEGVIREFVTRAADAPVFRELNGFYLSLTQSRRSRAGSTFQATIKGLFRRCGYPFEEQCVVNGKPDFLIPSEAHYRNNAPDCIIFTVKRTVRERWRQIATEGVRGKALFLATIDEKVTASQAAEMLENRICLVVPANLKQTVQAYQSAPNVISFEDFFTDHLDPAMVRWRRSGVI